MVAGVDIGEDINVGILCAGTENAAGKEKADDCFQLAGVELRDQQGHHR